MPDGCMRVAVLYSPAPGHVLESTMRLEPGATVLEALHASGLQAQAPELDWDRPNVAIWGRLAGLAQPLHDGDRVELLRPLRVDPKIARRERFRRQGLRAAGLFSRKGGGRAPDRKQRPD